MGNKNTRKAITFRINNIKVTKYFIDNSTNFWEMPKDYEYTFEVNSDIKYNKDEKKIATIVTASVYLEKEKKNKVCTLTVLVIYELPEYESIVSHVEDKVEVPVEVIKLFLSTHIAMVRGMLYEKNQGTFLQNVYLPPINVNDLVKEEKNELEAAKTSQK